MLSKISGFLFMVTVKGQACNFIKKETLAQVFSCEFYEIFKNTFFTERVQTAASFVLDFYTF